MKIHPIAVVDRFAASVFYPREPDWSERVETVSIARGAAEIRVHHVTARGAPRVRDGGFAIAADAPLETGTGIMWARAARPHELTSLLAGLHGFAEAAVHASDGTNPFGRHSATPYLTSPPMAAAEAIFVSLVVLSGVPVDAETCIADVVRVEIAGRQVEIECRDGERFFAQMVAADGVERVLGSLRLEGAVRYARLSPDGTAFIWRE